MPKFDFHVALSFAGEDRSHAEAIARALQKKKRRVFYDRDFTSHLWGKDHSEYRRIYGPGSLFFVPLLSSNHQKKEWPQFELSIAKRERAKRAKQNQDEYFLPVKIEDFPVLGFPDDLNYISVDSHTPAQIADAVDQKCREIERRWRDDKRGGGKRKASVAEIALLHDDIRRALSLVASAPLPLALETFQELFPKIDWLAAQRALYKAELIEIEHHRLIAIESVTSVLRKDEQQWRGLHETWIGILEPLKFHIDIRVSLSLHYLSARRFNDAVNLLAEAVESGDLGHWNDLYKSALTAFLDRRALSKIDPALRLRACNAVGICHVHAHDFIGAIPWFQKLRERSRRAGDDHWLGQAYLHLGIAYANQSLNNEGKKWYRRAEQHGRDTEDFVLVGRALGNLSQLLISENVKEAKEVLQESLEVKRSARDAVGVAVGKAQMARLLELTGDKQKAIEQYRRAIKSLQSTGQYDDCILARIHLAMALSETGRKSAARDDSRAAGKLAADTGIIPLRKLALGLEAQVCHELGDWSGVEDACNKLLECAKETEDSENVVCAMHGLGIAQKLQGQQSSGARTLAKALKEATRAENRHWMERCGVDMTRAVRNGKLGEPDAVQVKRRALKCERQRKRLVAGDLWSRLGNLYLFHHEDAAAAGLASFRAAANCLSSGGDIDGAVLALAGAAECNEQLRDYDASLGCLAEAQTLAEKHGRSELAAASLNQQAVLLQELGRFKEACAVHRKAISLQRKVGDTPELQKSLHNLGEALRKAEEYDDALDTLREAVVLARSRDDFESAVCATHSIGLVQEHQGNEEAASKTFQQCRNEAKSRRIWMEYVRAWEAMANLAWCQGKRPDAVKRYRRALKEAKKYGCDEFVGRIVLNLGNALHWMGQPKRARDTLAPSENEFSKYVDSYVWHARLADIYEECNQPDKAMDQWQKGEAAAIAANNAEYMAYCAAGIGTLQQAKGRHLQSESSLERALKHETDPEDRVILLRQLLDVLLKQRKEKRAGGVFDEANTIAMKHQLREHRIDMHMRVFDYKLPGKLGSKKEALHAWAVAMLEAIVMEDEEVVAKVVGHAVTQMTAVNLAPSLSELHSLRSDLSAAISEAFPGKKWLVDAVLQPLDLIERLLPSVGNPLRMAREVKGFIEELDES